MVHPKRWFLVEDADKAEVIENNNGLIENRMQLSLWGKFLWLVQWSLLAHLGLDSCLLYFKR